MEFDRTDLARVLSVSLPDPYRESWISGDSNTTEIVETRDWDEFLKLRSAVTEDRLVSYTSKNPDGTNRIVRYYPTREILKEYGFLRW
ncbi:MAG: hypothetical protein J4473_01450 [Candidatus Aenigmarchaeota archaeon]|nr:hypothetical protein [Candidatus Aenigmarchaeota archaeon]